MKLYYCDRERGTETFIAEAQEDKEIWRAMEHWLTEHGFGLIYVIHHIEKQKDILRIWKRTLLFCSCDISEEEKKCCRMIR